MPTSPNLAYNGRDEDDDMEDKTIILMFFLGILGYFLLRELGAIVGVAAGYYIGERM